MVAAALRIVLVVVLVLECRRGEGFIDIEAEVCAEYEDGECCARVEANRVFAAIDHDHRASYHPGVTDLTHLILNSRTPL
ncbi:MAG TPA: hypothetical protein DCY13_19210 [Verrucomicrobiales bacterium]|nr:hypothetical protein [Verrucomicrobiales bacterium]